MTIKPLRASLPLIGLTAACLTLSACGGSSDSGGVTSILTPSSGSSASSGANSSLAGTLATERFNAVANRMQVTTDRTGTPTNATATSTAYGTMAITYNASTNSYTVADSGATAVTVFTPADITASTAAFRHYRSGADDLSLLINASNNPRVNLSYVTYGVWNQNAAAGGTSTYRTLVYGVQTAYGNVPRSGVGTYTGIVDGYWTAGNTTRRLLGSTGGVTANFTTGQIATAVFLSGTADLSDNGAGPRTSLGTYSGIGNITTGTNLFGGALTASSTDPTADRTYSGNYNGAFYGPAAQEVGVSFDLHSGNGTGGTVSGVLVGRGSVVADAPATTTP
jgi:hypothetical protein